jgi:hypothetical protein
MLFMIIENFRNGDPLPVYRRFRDGGRLAPEGLSYVSSWVTEEMRSAAAAQLAAPELDADTGSRLAPS